MSTDYTLVISSSDGSETQIKVIDSLIPNNDTWTAADPAQWDTPGGAVPIWNADGAVLNAKLGIGSIMLDGFTKDKDKDDDGKGAKNYTDGLFPEGAFKWLIVAKT